jgi:hypothetical protein
MTAGQQFCNRHRLRFHQLLDDPGNIAAHPRSDSDGYSCRCRAICGRTAGLTLNDLATWLNPIVAGWMHYYGRY